MADIQITTQALTKDVTAPTFTSLNATDIYYVPNNSSRTILYFKNTNASSATITFDITQLEQGLTIQDHTISVPATTGERVIGNMPRKMEISTGTNDAKLKFSCSLATGVSVAAFSI